MTQAIKYLLARPEEARNTVTQDTTASVSSASVHETPITKRRFGSSMSAAARPSVGSRTSTTPKAMYTHESVSDSGAVGTAKGRRQRSSTSGPGTAIKRPGTAAEEYERRSLFGSPRSVRIYRDLETQPQNESIEIVARDDIPDHVDDPGAEWEGLENVRACCDGKHDGSCPPLSLSATLS